MFHIKYVATMSSVLKLAVSTRTNKAPVYSTPTNFCMRNLHILPVYKYHRKPYPSYRIRFAKLIWKEVTPLSYVMFQKFSCATQWFNVPWLQSFQCQIASTTLKAYLTTSDCMHGIIQTEAWLQHRGMLRNVSVSKQCKHYWKFAAYYHFGGYVMSSILNP